MTYMPGAFPDEDLYSIICRFHLLKGGSQNYTIRLITNRSTPMQVFSSAITQSAVAYFANAFDMSLNSLIERHTVLPYYSPFIKDASDGYIKKRLRARVTLLGSIGHRRLCIHCVDEDIKKFGVAYWHRAHQIPSVIACHRHRILLAFQPGLGVRGSFILPKPWQYEIWNEDKEECFISEFEMDRTTRHERISLVKKRFQDAIKFAQDVSALLNAGLGSIEHECLDEQYKARLGELGLYSSQQGINSEKILEHIRANEHMHFVSSVLANAPLREAGSIPKLISILAGIARGHAENIRLWPEAHLMMVRLFYNSFDDWASRFTRTTNDKRLIKFLT